MSGVLTHRRQHVPTPFVLAAVILLVSVAILAVMLPSITITETVSVPPANRSYDGIEQLRTLRSSAYMVVALGYDPVEALRIQRNATSFSIHDGYSAIEQLRMGRLSNADRSYDSIEDLRLKR